MRRPITVEPVKEMFRMSGCVTSVTPMAEPDRTCSRPAVCASSPSFSAVNGVSDPGLSTTQLPAASAGAATKVCPSKIGYRRFFDPLG